MHSHLSSSHRVFNLTSQGSDALDWNERVALWAIVLGVLCVFGVNRLGHGVNAMLAH